MTATRQRRTSPWKPIMARMAALLSEAFAAVLTCRHARAARFRHPSDWLRLTLLAGLILTFAVFAIAEALASPRRIFTDFSGSETLFAGLAIILFIGKIGRPQIYFDWLLFGATHAGIGLSLLPPEDTASTFSPPLTKFVGRVALNLARQNKAFKFQRKLMDGGACESTAYCEYGYDATGMCVALGNYHNRDTKRRRIASEYIDIHDWKMMVAWFVALIEASPEYRGRQPGTRQRIDDNFRSYRSLLISTAK